MFLLPKFASLSLNSKEKKASLAKTVLNWQWWVEGALKGEAEGLAGCESLHPVLKAGAVLSLRIG